MTSGRQSLNQLSPPSCSFALTCKSFRMKRVQKLAPFKRRSRNESLKKNKKRKSRYKRLPSSAKSNRNRGASALNSKRKGSKIKRNLQKNSKDGQSRLPFKSSSNNNKCSNKFSCNISSSNNKSELQTIKSKRQMMFFPL